MPESELEVLLVAGPLEVRGRCTYSLRLAERLGDHGVASRLITPDARHVKPATGREIALAEYRRLETPFWGRVVRRFLLHDALQSTPHLIHVQSRRALRVGSWLARRLKRPFVLTVHEHLGRRERLPIDRWCRRIIAVSESVRDDLLRRRVPEEFVTVVPGGVCLPDLARTPVPLEPGRVPVVGAAGRLEPDKGFPWFLGAARRILDAGRDVEFVLAGSGPEEANLRRLARELDLTGKVTFVPHVLDFADALGAMDVFCLPSLRRGLGTVMLEAMALARPVIAAGAGGAHAVVRHGETGLVVPPRSSEELAKGVLELLDDPPRARALGAAARDLVARDFHVDRMALQTVELYREIVQDAPRLAAAQVQGA